MPKAPQHAEVGMRELRDHLSKYLARVREGDEIVVTDRGKPVARIISEGGLSRFDRLVAEGVITPPSRPRTPASELPRIPFQGDFGKYLRWAKGEDDHD
jgi:prevent-host-death family protein